MASSTTSSAARGTILLVASRGGYFVLGYLSVVLLARGLGPAAYGAYGVLMSILVWLEQAGKFAAPSAGTKLLAEATQDQDALAKSIVAVNLALYLAFFALIWLTAPWLAAWFDLPNGAYWFRIAALDLPLYGLYTSLQAIHQGRHRFVLLGVAEVVYAAAKFAGIALLVALGATVEAALLINVASSGVGAAVLARRLGLSAAAPWFSHMSPVIDIAWPMGLYSLALLLLSSLDLWVLQMMTGGGEATQVGVFVAALNIARVPGFGLAAVAAVLLPSVARAAARRDLSLARLYLMQALRFLIVLYAPIAFALMSQAEPLLQWIYSNQYAGGGVLLSVLLIAHGLWALHAILGSVLIALGCARASAAVMGLLILPAVPMFVAGVHWYGGLGAAIANVCLPLLGAALFWRWLWRRIGAFLRLDRLARMGAAVGCMILVYLLPLQPAIGYWPMLALALFTYGIVLFGSGEVQWREVVELLPKRRQGL